MKKVLLLAALAILPIDSRSEPLEVNGPFYKQLVAMGYTLEEVEVGTIANRGSVAILAIKDEKYTWIGRVFNAKPRKDVEKKILDEALAAANDANIAFSFTTTINDGSIVCGIHLFGEYSPSTYGIALSEIEMCNIVFDKHPNLLKLAL